MITLSWVWLVVIAIMMATFFILCLVNCYRIRKKIKDEICGNLLVDQEDPTQYGGVYLQTFTDPKAFTDGDIVHFVVKKVN